MKNKRNRRQLGLGCLLILLVLTILLIMLPLVVGPQIVRPEKGFACSSGLIPMKAGSIRLLVDSTAYNTNADSGVRVIRQEIFDHILSSISNAKHFVYVDYFLWNNWQGATPEKHRLLSSELSRALIRRKTHQPNIDILVLTDPLNRVYGETIPKHFEQMSQAGIPVVFTDVSRLPDSNLIYARLAHCCGPVIKMIPGVSRWLQKPRFGNPFEASGNPLSGQQMARLLYFKANHRKVLVCDKGGSAQDMRLIVSSMNPADSSSAHSNIGLQLDGAVAGAALLCELEAVSWSAENPENTLPAESVNRDQVITRLRAYADHTLEANESARGTIHAEWLTEDAIQRRIMELLYSTDKGDQVRIALFYLSDVKVIESIKRAIHSGASLRLLLDPNKDAFGRTKNGVPNRPVAADILKYAAKHNNTNVVVRWADTHGEQFHPKAMSITTSDSNRCSFICGSANWTRRNIGGCNLEADVCVENDAALNKQFNAFFDRIWNNETGLSWTVDYSQYAETGVSGWWKKRMWLFQEKTGAGTF